MNKFAEMIDRERVSRGWTIYQLSKKSGVAQATIHQWLYKGSVPTLPAIEQVCVAFGLSLVEFFGAGEFVELVGNRKELFTDWLLLADDERAAIRAHIKSYLSKR